MSRLSPFTRLPLCLLGALALSALSGCGLFSRGEPYAFRTYTLKGVDYAEGVEVVHEAVRRFSVQHFGGTGITWDPGTGNLTLDPVYDGNRRMNFYVHVVARPPDVDLEMLALVEHLRPGNTSGAIGWVDPMMDVPLEKDIYQAAVNELLRRRTTPGSPAPTPAVPVPAPPANAPTTTAPAAPR